MLKEERLEKISKMVEANKVVKVSDITKKLAVTEMTIRRDLQELESRGVVTRIHGGAKKANLLKEREYSHLEKQSVHIEEKKVIAQKIASMIHDDDTVFLGPGTTIELVYDYIEVEYAKIITNSIHVFQRFVDDARFELILVGGTYRSRTGAFIGSLANEILEHMRVKKAFIGTNGIFDNNIATSNEEEGLTQSIILNNANEKYIIADHSKLNQDDFYRFYHLDEVNGLVTDDQIEETDQLNYQQYTKII